MEPIEEWCIRVFRPDSPTDIAQVTLTTWRTARRVYRRCTADLPRRCRRGGCARLCIGGDARRACGDGCPNLPERGRLTPLARGRCALLSVVVSSVTMRFSPGTMRCLLLSGIVSAMTDTSCDSSLRRVVGVRFDATVIERLRRIADEDERSVGSVIRIACADWLRRRQEQAPAA
jgi:hypothetical protein